MTKLISDEDKLDNAFTLARYLCKCAEEYTGDYMLDGQRHTLAVVAAILLAGDDS